MIETQLPVVVLLGLDVVLSATAGLVLGRSRRRRYVAWTLAVIVPWLAWLAPPDPNVWRFCLAVYGALAPMHMFDLVTDRRDLSPLHRAWFMLTPFDTREVVRVPPRFERRWVERVALWGAVCGLCLWIVVEHTPAAGWQRHALRWPLGLIGFYAAVEVLCAALMIGYLAFGLEPPLLHDDPGLARTVQEFWGGRWNLEIHRWLRLHIFLPLARARRPMAGIIAAFVGSTVLHVWIMFVCQGWAMAGLWAIFFLLHGGFVVAERRWRVARWPPALSRVWTVSLFALSAPLFVEPLLRVFPG